MLSICIFDESADLFKFRIGGLHHRLCGVFSSSNSSLACWLFDLVGSTSFFFELRQNFSSSHTFLLLLLLSFTHRLMLKKLLLMLITKTLFSLTQQLCRRHFFRMLRHKFHFYYHSYCWPMCGGSWSSLNGARKELFEELKYCGRRREKYRNKVNPKFNSHHNDVKKIEEWKAVKFRWCVWTSVWKLCSSLNF